jgi:hypothetical protein
MATTYDSPMLASVGHSRRMMLLVGMASSAVTAAFCLAVLPGLDPGVSARRFGTGRPTGTVSLAAPARFGTGRGMASHPPSAPADGTASAASIPGPRGRGAAFVPHR